MSIFSKVSLKKPKSSTFNMSYDRKFSLNMGDLVPCHLQEVVPGDHFSVSTEQMLRFAPMIAPVMHEVNVYIHYFFVPNRILWDGWEEFITGGEDGLSSSLFPVFDLSGFSPIPVGSLFDYLGLPIGNVTSDYFWVSILPFAAYQTIYNEYYRDENLIPKIDFVVHAIGFSDKSQLKGRYVDVTTRENFSRTMVISAFSFTEVVQRAEKLMPDGGSILTLTYGASQQVVPNYNVMGVAKAALEAMVRTLAADCGPNAIRINAISAGPVRTLAGNGIGAARAIFSYQRRNAPLRRTVDIDEIGQSALYLLSDMSSGVTGEIHYVDSGYNILSMPSLEELKQSEEARGE